MVKTRLTDFINVELLQSMQDMFVKSTGLIAHILDQDGNPITYNSVRDEFYEKVIKSSPLAVEEHQQQRRLGAMKALIEEKPYIHDCFGCVKRFAVPIIIRGQYLGCFMGGRAIIEEPVRKSCDVWADSFKLDKDSFFEEIGKMKRFTSIELNNCIELAAYFMTLVEKIARENFYNRQQVEEVKIKSESQMNYISEISTIVEKATGNISREAYAIAEEITGESKDKFIKLAEEVKKFTDEVQGTIEYAKFSEWQLTYNDYNYSIEQMMDIVCGTANRKLSEQQKEVSYRIGCQEDAMLMGDAGCISQVINKLINFCAHELGADRIRVYADSSKKGYATFLEINIQTIIGKSGQEIFDILDNNFDFRTLAAYMAVNTEDNPFAQVGNLVRHMNGMIRLDTYGGGLIEFVMSVPQLEVVE